VSGDDVVEGAMSVTVTVKVAKAPYCGVSPFASDAEKVGAETMILASGTMYEESQTVPACPAV